MKSSQHPGSPGDESHGVKNIFDSIHGMLSAPAPEVKGSARKVPDSLKNNNWISKLKQNKYLQELTLSKSPRGEDCVKDSTCVDSFTDDGVRPQIVPYGLDDISAKIPQLNPCEKYETGDKQNISISLDHECSNADSLDKCYLKKLTNPKSSTVNDQNLLSNSDNRKSNESTSGVDLTQNDLHSNVNSDSINTRIYVNDDNCVESKDIILSDLESDENPLNMDEFVVLDEAGCSCSENEDEEDYSEKNTNSPAKLSLQDKKAEHNLANETDRSPNKIEAGMNNETPRNLSIDRSKEPKSEINIPCKYKRKESVSAREEIGSECVNYVDLKSQNIRIKDRSNSQTPGSETRAALSKKIERVTDVVESASYSRNDQKSQSVESSSDKNLIYSDISEDEDGQDVPITGRSNWSPISSDESFYSEGVDIVGEFFELEECDEENSEKMTEDIALPHNTISSGLQDDPEFRYTSSSRSPSNHLPRTSLGSINDKNDSFAISDVINDEINYKESEVISGIRNRWSSSESLLTIDSLPDLSDIEMGDEVTSCPGSAEVVDITGFRSPEEQSKKLSDVSPTELDLSASLSTHHSPANEENHNSPKEQSKELSDVSSTELDLSTVGSSSVSPAKERNNADSIDVITHESCRKNGGDYSFCLKSLQVSNNANPVKTSQYVCGRSADPCKDVRPTTPLLDERDENEVSASGTCVYMQTSPARSDRKVYSMPIQTQELGSMLPSGKVEISSEQSQIGAVSQKDHQTLSQFSNLPPTGFEDIILPRQYHEESLESRRRDRANTGCRQLVVDFQTAMMNYTNSSSKNGSGFHHTIQKPASYQNDDIIPLKGLTTSGIHKDTSSTNSTCNIIKTSIVKGQSQPTCINESPIAMTQQINSAKIDLDKTAHKAKSPAVIHIDNNGGSTSLSDFQEKFISNHKEIYPVANVQDLSSTDSRSLHFEEKSQTAKHTILVDNTEISNQVKSVPHTVKNISNTDNSKNSGESIPTCSSGPAAQVEPVVQDTSKNAALVSDVKSTIQIIKYESPSQSPLKAFTVQKARKTFPSASLLRKASNLPWSGCKSSDSVTKRKPVNIVPPQPAGYHVSMEKPVSVDNTLTPQPDAHQASVDNTKNHPVSLILKMVKYNPNSTVTSEDVNYQVNVVTDVNSKSNVCEKNVSCVSASHNVRGTNSVPNFQRLQENSPEIKANTTVTCAKKSESSEQNPESVKPIGTFDILPKSKSFSPDSLKDLTDNTSHPLLNTSFGSQTKRDIQGKNNSFVGQFLLGKIDGCFICLTCKSKFRGDKAFLQHIWFHVHMNFEKCTTCDGTVPGDPCENTENLFNFVSKLEDREIFFVSSSSRVPLQKDINKGYQKCSISTTSGSKEKVNGNVSKSGLDQRVYQVDEARKEAIPPDDVEANDDANTLGIKILNTFSMADFDSLPIAPDDIGGNPAQAEKEISQNCDTPGSFFVCSKCRTSYLHQEELQHHLDTSHDSAACFKCVYCTFETCDKTAYTSHYAGHTDSSQYSFNLMCMYPECRSVATTLESHFKHLNIHKNWKPSCCHCHTQFVNLNLLLNHYIQSLLSVYSCKYCSAKAYQKKTFLEHMRKSHCSAKSKVILKKFFVCTPSSITNKPSQNAEPPVSKARSVASIQNGVNGTVSEVDQQKSATDSSNLEQSFSTFLCQKCSFVCNDKKVFLVHKKIHAAFPEPDVDKPFTCPCCPTSFALLKELMFHLRYHDKDVQFAVFQCPEDGYVTNDKFKGKLHLSQTNHSNAELFQIKTAHHQSKIFHCPFCSIKVQEKAIFTQHLSIHGELGEKEAIVLKEVDGDSDEEDYGKLFVSNINKVQSKDYTDMKETFSYENSIPFVQKPYNLVIRSSPTYRNSAQALSQKLKVLYTHNSGFFACLVCEAKFRVKNLLFNHLMEHLEISYRCHECGNFSKNYDAAICHALRDHQVERNCIVYTENLDEKVKVVAKRIPKSMPNLEAPSNASQKRLGSKRKGKAFTSHRLSPLTSTEVGSNTLIKLGIKPALSENSAITDEVMQFLNEVDTVKALNCLIRKGAECSWCKMCGKAFLQTVTGITKVLLHILAKHLKYKPHTCHHCTFSAYSFNVMKKHYETIHGRMNMGSFGIQSIKEDVIHLIRQSGLDISYLELQEYEGSAPENSTSNVCSLSANQSACYKCDVCKETFDCPFKMARHKKAHSKTVKNTARKSTSFYGSSVSEIIRATGHMAQNPTVAAHLIKKRLSENLARRTTTPKKHGSTHNNPPNSEKKMYKCPKCEYVTERRHRAMLYHFNKKHGMETFIKCSYCHVKFTCKDLWQKHSSLIHPGLKMQFQTLPIEDYFIPVDNHEKSKVTNIDQEMSTEWATHGTSTKVGDVGERLNTPGSFRETDIRYDSVLNDTCKEDENELPDIHQVTPVEPRKAKKRKMFLGFSAKKRKRLGSLLKNMKMSSSSKVKDLEVMVKHSGSCVMSRKVLKSKEMPGPNDNHHETSTEDDLPSQSSIISSTDFMKSSGSITPFATIAVKRAATGRVSPEGISKKQKLCDIGGFDVENIMCYYCSHSSNSVQNVISHTQQKHVGRSWVAQLWIDKITGGTYDHDGNIFSNGFDTDIVIEDKFLCGLCNFRAKHYVSVLEHEDREHQDKSGSSLVELKTIIACTGARRRNQQPSFSYSSSPTSLSVKSAVSPSLTTTVSVLSGASITTNSTAPVEKSGRPLEIKEADEDKAEPVLQHLELEPAVIRDTVYNCSECEVVSTSEYQFRCHLATHNNFTRLVPDLSQNPHLTCTTCSYRAPNLQDFMKHQTDQVVVVKFECGVCGYRGNSTRAVKVHSNRQHRDITPKVRQVYDQKPACRDVKSLSLIVDLDPQVQLEDFKYMTQHRFKLLLQSEPKKSQ